MKRPDRTVAVLACCGLAAFAMAGCGGAEPGKSTSAPAGIDGSAIDRAVAPGDDFYGFANGARLARTDIPADRSTYGPTEEMTEKTLLRTRELLEAAGKGRPQPGTVEQQASDYYAAYLDQAAIEVKGLAPLAPLVDRIAAVDSKSALARLLGEELRADVDALNNTDFYTDRLFGLWVTAGLNDPGTNTPYLLQGGLDMPDREYYVDTSPRMAKIREALTAHVSRTLALAKVPDAAAAAATIVALETKIAQAHATRQESADLTKANNPWSRVDFDAKAPGLDWATFFGAAKLDQVPTIIVWHPSAIRGLSALVRSEPLAAWKWWLTFHTVDRNASVLPKAVVEERFAFHGTTLSGTPQLAERWKSAVGATNAALPEAVGRIYVATYFPPETKVQIRAMVKNLIGAFDQRVERLDWMSPETKVKARRKLSTLRVGVGYPDTWVDYSSVRIDPSDAFGNRQRAERFQYERSLAKLAVPVDKGEWWMEPQLVNAVNLPLQNALNFPAAFLAPPFFDAAAPAATNYGAMGAVIGHEISHSFDDTGAMFDADGRLANWWTPEDLKHFQEAGAQLAAQYDAYMPLTDLHVNGRQTLSENIADLAGLATAYDGWRASLGGKAAPDVAGFTGEQQFFLAYAQSYLIKWREPALRQAVVADGHAPGQYRAATVRNLDAWYEAFGAKAGQGLFLPPAQRVRVW